MSNLEGTGQKKGPGPESPGPCREGRVRLFCQAAYPLSGFHAAIRCTLIHQDAIFGCSGHGLHQLLHGREFRPRLDQEVTEFGSRGFRLPVPVQSLGARGFDNFLIPRRLRSGFLRRVDFGVDFFVDLVVLAMFGLLVFGVS